MGNTKRNSIVLTEDILTALNNQANTARIQAEIARQQAETIRRELFNENQPARVNCRGELVGFKWEE